LVSGAVPAALRRSGAPDAPRRASAKAAPSVPAGAALPAGAVARLGETRFRDGAGICDLALSRDGKVLASSGYNRGVCFWDAVTGKLLRAFSAPDETACYNVALSPDARQFVPAMHPLR